MPETETSCGPFVCGNDHKRFIKSESLSGLRGFGEGIVLTKDNYVFL